MQQSHWLLPAMYLRSSSEKAVLPKTSLGSPFMAQGQLQYDKSFKRQGDVHTTKLSICLQSPCSRAITDCLITAAPHSACWLTESLPEQTALQRKKNMEEQETKPGSVWSVGVWISLPRHHLCTREDHFLSLAGLFPLSLTPADLPNRFFIL